MNQANALRFVKGLHADYLSVAHRAVVDPQVFTTRQHVVIQTDLQFNLTGWNSAAEELHGSLFCSSDDFTYDS